MNTFTTTTPDLLTPIKSFLATEEELLGYLSPPSAPTEPEPFFPHVMSPSVTSPVTFHNIEGIPSRETRAATTFIGTPTAVPPVAAPIRQPWQGPEFDPRHLQRPPLYDGTQVAITLMSWTHKMREFIAIAFPNVSPASQVRLAAQYLTGLADLWWMNERADPLSPAPRDLEDFLLQVKTTFWPPAACREARSRLRLLVQTTTVSAYAAAFFAIQMEVSDLSAAEAMDKFMSGLNLDVQSHVALREPIDLKTAMRYAVTYDTIQRGSCSRPAQRNPPPVHLTALPTSSSRPGPASDRPKKLTDGERKTLTATGGCFACRQVGHLRADCPTFPYTPRKTPSTSTPSTSG